MINASQVIERLEVLFAKFKTVNEELTEAESIKVFKRRIESRWQKLEIEKITAIALQDNWSVEYVEKYLDISRKARLQFYKQKLNKSSTK